VIALGSVYALLYIKHGGPLATIPGSTLGIIGAFLGMGSLAVRSVRGIWEADPASVETNRADLVEIGSIPLLCILSAIAVSMAAEVIPHTCDPLLFAFDSNLGFQPSRVMGQFFRSHLWLAYISAVAYNYLPIGLVALRVV